MRNANKINFKSCSRGRLFLCSFICLLNLNFVFAQKTEVIHQSDFKHDYVLPRSEYLENLKDTSSSKYVSTLRATCKSRPGSIGGIVTLIGMRSKELGGNVFYLSSYQEVDSSLTMIIKVYYAFKKVFDANERNRLKQKVMVYSSDKHIDRYQCFLLNDSLKCFNSRNTFEFAPKPGEKYVVRTCSGPQFLIVVISGVPIVIPKKTKAKIKYKEGAEMLFVGISSGGLVKKEQINPKGKMHIAKSGLGFLEYRVGRVLMEIYKPEN